MKILALVARIQTGPPSTRSMLSRLRRLLMPTRAAPRREDRFELSYIAASASWFFSGLESDGFRYGQ